MQRGTLNTNVPPDGISGTPSREEDFAYDPLGNWNEYVVKVSGATTLNQSRTHTEANEIATIDTSSALIAHDPAGNTVKVPKPSNWSAAFDLTYDEWNRLVKVMDGGSTVAAYTYDGAEQAGDERSKVLEQISNRVWWPIFMEAR